MDKMNNDKEYDFFEFPIKLEKDFAQKYSTPIISTENNPFDIFNDLDVSSNKLGQPWLIPSNLSESYLFPSLEYTQEEIIPEKKKNKLEYKEEIIKEVSYHANRIIKAVYKSSERSKSEIINELRQEKESLEKQHFELKNFNKEIENKLERLRNENAQMREIMSNNYSARFLILISGSMSIGLMGSLIASIYYGVNLLHPIIAVLGLIGSIGFTILGFLRYNKDKEEKEK